MIPKKGSRAPRGPPQASPQSAPARLQMSKVILGPPRTQASLHPTSPGYPPLPHYPATPLPRFPQFPQFPQFPLCPPTLPLHPLPHPASAQPGLFLTGGSLASIPAPARPANRHGDRVGALGNAPPWDGVQHSSTPSWNLPRGPARTSFGIRWGGSGIVPESPPPLTLCPQQAAAAQPPGARALPPDGGPGGSHQMPRGLQSRSCPCCG